MTKARTLADNFAADINGITAGTGITGGGTSGTVTITNEMATTITAKGDLLAGTGNAAFDNLAAGASGETLVADSSATTGLRWQGDYAAGKNKIINGDFSINQRGFTSNTTTDIYNFDRWSASNGGTSGTQTITPQTFTPGAAPVAGYEGTQFLQSITASGADANTFAFIQQKIEDVRTFAGQTVTVSFWAKAASGTPKIGVSFRQAFGSGGSSAVNGTGIAVTISTSFARYSVTYSVPSISGKTVGSPPGNLGLELWLSAGSDFATRSGSVGLQNNTFQIWGVQVEAGSVATAFQTATGTLAGELAACQRYFQVLGGDNVYEYFGIGSSMSASESNCVVPLKVTMRSAPTTTFTTASNYKIVEGVGAGVAATSVAGDILTKNTLAIQFQSTNNLNAYRANRMMSNNTTSATIQISAEL